MTKMWNVFDLKVGDTVMKSCEGAPVSIRSVTRVMKRFVELNDGSQWSGSSSYPEDHFNRKRIGPVTEEGRETLLRKRLIKQIKATDWDMLNTASLHKVLDTYKRDS